MQAYYLRLVGIGFPRRLYADFTKFLIYYEEVFLIPVGQSIINQNLKESFFPFSIPSSINFFIYLLKDSTHSTSLFRHCLTTIVSLVSYGFLMSLLIIQLMFSLLLLGQKCLIQLICLLIGKFGVFYSYIASEKVLLLKKHQKDFLFQLFFAYNCYLGFFV